jgi:hypothetical protein
MRTPSRLSATVRADLLPQTKDCALRHHAGIIDKESVPDVAQNELTVKVDGDVGRLDPRGQLHLRIECAVITATVLARAHERHDVKFGAQLRRTVTPARVATQRSADLLSGTSGMRACCVRSSASRNTHRATRKHVGRLQAAARQLGFRRRLALAGDLEAVLATCHIVWKL